MLSNNLPYGASANALLIAEIAAISRVKAEQILNTVSGDIARVLSFSAAKLGLTERQRTRLVRAIELGRKSVYLSQEPTCISSPDHATGLLMHLMGHLEQEHVFLVCLNTRNFVLDIRNCYIGNINAACLRAGEIFRHLIQCNSAAFIIAHNHPSGDPSPSQEDISVTKTLHAASCLIEIQMLDHIIVGRATHYSMAQNGILPSK